MNRKRQKRIIGKKFYLGIVIVFVAICLMLSAFSFTYYRFLHTTIREESQSYLQEISQRIGSNLTRTMDESFSALHTMGDSLEAAGDNSLDAFRPLLKSQQSHWQYENILLVDKNGKAYDINNSGTTFFTLDDAMRTDMLNKKDAMTTQVINNKEYILFAVPLAGVSVSGHEIISLAATYDLSALDHILSMTTFDNQAYSQVITKAGTAVTQPTSAQAIKAGYNIFATLKTAELDMGESIERVQADIKSDLDGQISFSLSGARWYMIYTPIQPDNWYLLTFVPSQAVNARSDMLLQSTLIICSIIVLAFCGLIAVLFLVFSSNRKKLERMAYVDDVTGGNTSQRFYELAQQTLDAAHGAQYALIFTNVENFKILNSQMGRKNCDEVLKHFYTYVSSVLEPNECIGRITADNFCILLAYPSEEKLITRLAEWERGAEQYIHDVHFLWAMPQVVMGIYIIENESLPFSEMIDRAKLALKNVKQSDANILPFSFYDDAARRQLFREKQLSDMMHTALANREFQLYLQPKVHLPDEKIGGAEALVRWLSPTEGMIYPNDFIPLFEKNGFIVQVDLWIFEEVCRTMRDWVDRGLTPVKVSVNCSRVHFKDAHFLKPYIRIADEYGIERSLIEIELTESVVFEDMERLIRIIQEIRAAGLGCSMDDFGSGYSSLNLIQSIPVDTLKIDKIFFQRRSGQQDRTEAVVGSVVQLAKSLSLTTVAEGVEHRDQVELLKHVGCEYIQGYVFAKPMPVDEFNTLIFGAEER